MNLSTNNRRKQVDSLHRIKFLLFFFNWLPSISVFNNYPDLLLLKRFTIFMLNVICYLQTALPSVCGENAFPPLLFTLYFT